MTRSVPLRHLTVHLPAAGDGPPAARGQAAKGATRPNFAELLRTPQRPASRRPAASAARGDALPPDALPLPEAPQAMTDVAEAARIEPLSSVNDSAGDEDPGVDTGAPQDHPHVAAPALPEPVGACAVDELQPDARGRLIVGYLATTVADFCNDPAVHTGDSWTVRLSLNEAILPSTTLHLSLSLHWLLLRFECTDAQSAGLIGAHREMLQRTLEEAVSPRRDVSIDLN